MSLKREKLICRCGDYDDQGYCSTCAWFDGYNQCIDEQKQKVAELKKRGKEKTHSFKSKDYEDGYNDGSCAQLKHDCSVKDKQVAELKKRGLDNADELLALGMLRVDTKTTHYVLTDDDFKEVFGIEKT